MKLGLARLDWDPTLERLIGVVRLALAAFALFIVWVDPTQPSKHVAIAYTAFIVYLVYSAAVLLFTEAGNTPFFPFFVVIMLTAGIRWGIWASWAVTAYSLGTYGLLLFVEPPTPLDMNNDLMQLSYFLIVGILGGYLAEYRRRRDRARDGHAARAHPRRHRRRSCRRVAAGRHRRGGSARAGDRGLPHGTGCG